jgi:hypothetical protein
LSVAAATTLWVRRFIAFIERWKKYQNEDYLNPGFSLGEHAYFRNPVAQLNF